MSDRVIRFAHIINQEGPEAGLFYLEKEKASCPDEAMAALLEDLMHARSAFIMLDTSPERKMDCLESLEVEVQELVKLVEPDESYLVEIAYCHLLHAALLVGPSVRLSEIADPAIQFAKSLMGVPVPTSKILREFRNNLFHRSTLAACAMGNAGLAMEAYSAMDKEHWQRDRHLVSLLEPFGVTLPPGLRT